MPATYKIDTSYFDNIGPNQAYIIGLLYADGTRAKDKNYIAIVLQYRDRDILDKIKTELKYEGPILVKKSRGLNWQDQVLLGFSNKKIADRLFELGLVPAKSLILDYPNWLTPETERHFIRGCIDGDGHIGRLGFLHFVGTKSMCDGIAKACAQYCGAESIIWHGKATNNNTYSLKIGVRTGLTRALEWLYSDADLFIDRKHAAAMKQLEIQKAREQSRICSVKGCGQPVFEHGLCLSHYREEQFKNNRSPKKPCSVEGCQRTLYAKGLCSKHYQRMIYAKTKGKRDPNRSIICSVEGCTNTVHAKGMCLSHYRKKRYVEAGRPDHCASAPVPARVNL